MSGYLTIQASDTTPREYSSRGAEDLVMPRSRLISLPRPHAVRETGTSSRFGAMEVMFQRSPLIIPTHRVPFPGFLRNADRFPGTGIACMCVGGQHAVLYPPRGSTVVTRSRPYPLKVLAVSGWRLGTQAECFASIHSALDSALNAALDSVLCERPWPLGYAHFPSGFSAILAANSFWRAFS